MRKKPARKIKASAVKNLFKFPSTKSCDDRNCRTYSMILVESSLEKDYCFHLECDSVVYRYYPQPRTFTLTSELLTSRDYTPDFEVLYHDGRKAFIEIKKDFESLDPLYLHKLELATRQMAVDGYGFLWVDESQIRLEPLLNNLKRLQRYRSAEGVHAGTYSLLKSSVPNPSRLHDLINNPLGIRLETIYGLVASRYVMVDLRSAPLTVESEVYYA